MMYITWNGYVASNGCGIDGFNHVSICLFLQFGYIIYF